MTINAITSAYLADFADRGAQPAELAELARKHIDLAATSYEGRCLTRPVFLTHDEFAVLRDDLVTLHRVLASLPGRLFGGDLATFARAVGLSAAQTVAISRGGSAYPTMMGRADAFRDETAFRVMELNLGSALGGLDNALLNRAFLAHPAVADFVARHRLTYTDTMTALVSTLRTECAIPEGARPFIAVTDQPESFRVLERQLRHGAAGLAAYGLDAVACHLGQLEVRGKRVWLGSRPVDVIYRVFLIKDLLNPAVADLIEPLLAAAERGQLRFFTPLDAEVYGSKAALALASDEANRPHFSAAELASLDRCLPWTRLARPGQVTLPGGERADLTEYALAERTHLVLKPAALASGAGVVQGWLTEPGDWRDRLLAALNGPFVLQRRVRPLAEPFPADGGPRPWVLWWGAFLSAEGYGGMIVRGSEDPDAAVMSLPHGAIGTCCFHQPQPVSR